MSRRVAQVWLSAFLAPAVLGSTTAAAQTASIKFAAFGDIGNTAGSAAVANLTRAQGAQFITMLGDNCYDSQPIADQINANYSAEKAAGKLMPALGNHEFSDPCGGGRAASGYLAYFTLPNNERYYDYVKGPVHFFAMNSATEPDGNTKNSKQARWLRSRLSKSTSPWNIVYFHHPPYSSGYHRSSEFMRWPFEQWGADVVMSGHEHDYERVHQDANKDGVILPYFVSGMGGESRRTFGGTVAGSVKRYSGGDGALFVTATATSLSFEFRNTAGSVIDTYSMTKPAKNTTKAFDFKTVP